MKKDQISGFLGVEFEDACFDFIRGIVACFGDLAERRTTPTAMNGLWLEGDLAMTRLLLVTVGARCKADICVTRLTTSLHRFPSSHPLRV